MSQMSLKRKAIYSGDSIEQEFLDALARLQIGKPKTKKMKDRLAAGKMKITISNVAVEAGRSRTLIGLDKNCRYPVVREKIREAKEKPSLPTTHTEIIQRLRAEKLELQVEVRKLRAEATAHYFARVKAEKELEQERARAARVNKLLAGKQKIARIVGGDSQS
ncbi:hypothetical protein E6A55_04165 [Cupriavidus necator H16]|uniref:Uncharacterized protein n=2 Tax=Cupriavidus necator (strain ATCC 17699 / DSM 428 / KCTC 22496 / NCIMB 10442 / H16 / Stanier 337) TaxID=381666 RepID=A0AAE5ZB07_CUPNH|nr:hypothetical protein [Cupriavidus necator]QCB99894.1 hypothetical protein E6A55_04165 [Cupriavidus necator H16]QQB77289.1 hypothetical protein I6H87_02905 [Cupriavidus necator]WKA41739.1 hypothetical protein QWP09_04150 [Cupriavidus necator]